jgi:hypothetical protein
LRLAALRLLAANPFSPFPPPTQILLRSVRLHFNPVFLIFIMAQAHGQLLSM